MKLYTIKGVADELQIGMTTVRALIRKGDLPCVRIGRSVRVSSDQLTDFINERRVHGQQRKLISDDT